MLFAIRSKQIITPGEILDGRVIVSGDRIIAVTGNEITDSIPVIDIGNDVLMPGIVDPHVHINEPGRTEWEGFDTATKAAIAGGITSLVEMPLNASPVTTTVDAYQQKLDAARGRIHCDCGFWGGLVPGNLDSIEPMIEMGVRGFKAFLVHSGIDDFPAVSRENLEAAMPILAAHGLPLLVHCELESKNTALWQEERSYPEYLASRPRDWENNAIRMMIGLCEKFRCPVHIVHLSSSDILPEIRAAKEKGLPLTVETAPHYLYFSAEKIADGRTEFKCAPPIREWENNKKLLAALGEGLIDFVATDHSPSLPEMKHLDSGSFQKAWGGIASLQLSLPALWTAASKRNFVVADIGRWLCESPARLPALQGKGLIEKGATADLVAWNPEQEFRVNAATLYHRHKISPYHGEILKGVVNETWLAGKKVFSQGKFLHLNEGKIL